VKVIPTAHGSGLFQRGETQVLNVATLGMAKMDQMIDGIDPVTRKRYLHHYNFPPFSTGEPGFMRGPKRREIGHGALAERALFPVVPSLEEFPYTIRLVSEVLASNGSSSMASVCGSTLSMMDAGVPIKAPVAGIAMGLIYADDQYVTLTDILGAEDAFGDMDFKVAGTSEFVTALQLDTKIDGIPADVLAGALDQAREARLAILDIMAEAIAEPRPEVAETAPKIISFEIPIDKIGEVIGPKGKVINAIQAETGANISVDDDGMVGTVAIAAVDGGAMAEAERQIKLILDPPTAEVGETYEGRVVNITKFGAFVNILPGRDGLLHISKLGGGKRIDRVEDVVDLGDAVTVRVDDIDPNGKISLALVGDDAPKASEGDADGVAHSAAPAREAAGSDDAPSGNRRELNFAEAFDAELTESFGDLGPAPVRSGGGGGGGRGGDRSGRGGSGGNRGGGGGRRRR
jgi:polyribonucleotide nucleotidyltransferase